VSDLSAAGAHTVLPDLTDTQTVLAALVGHSALVGYTGLVG